MDDADNRVHSAFFVSEEGTMSSFEALRDVIDEHGPFCSLHADRGSHCWHTPEAGGKVDKENPTRVGRALQQLGIGSIPAYSPQARGRSERMFGTFRKRLPQELRSRGITTMEEANRFPKEVHLPAHDALFTKEPEDEASAFVPFAGNVRDIPCVREERVVGNDNTVRHKGLVLRIASASHRHHFVKAKVRVHDYPDGELALFHGPRCIGRYRSDGSPVTRQESGRTAA